MKAFVAVNILPEAAEQAEKLAILEGTAKAYLRAASIRVYANDQQQAREVLNRGITLFPDSVELRRALLSYAVMRWRQSRSLLNL